MVTKNMIPTCQEKIETVHEQMPLTDHFPISLNTYSPFF